MRSHLVVLTRREEDNQRLAALLEAEGLQVVSYPCLATEAVPPDRARLRALAAGGPVDAIAFPSRASVDGFFDQPLIRETLCPELPGLLAAVGPSTAALLEARGRPPEVTARPANGEALARALVARLGAEARVLIPGGDRPRPELPRGLQEGGLIPLPLQVYRHADLRPPPLPPPPPDAILCASPSAARTFCRANPRLASSAPFVAIGATTGSSLRALGAAEVHVAPSVTPGDLLETILRVAAPPAGKTPRPPRRLP